MGGLSFLNTVFVFGTAVALVPIIIHLVQRRRIQQVVFGSVRFLRTMSQRVVRRRRLTELLLILLRVLALAGLALAFARPFIWKPVQRVGAESRPDDEVALILVDNSYSMSANKGLDKAKKQALEILNNPDLAATKIGVACFNSEFQLLAPFDSGLVEARSVVEGIAQTARGTSLGMALEQADRLLVQRPEQNRRVFLVSDFQRTAWTYSDWKMTPGIALAARGVAEADLPNVYIERVAVPRLVVAGGFAEVISALVVNRSDKPVNDAKVVVKIGQVEVEKMSVSIRANASTPVSFRRTFTDAGDIVGSMAISVGGVLPADDTAYFCVHVTPRVRVLIVNGDDSQQLVRNDAFFLKTALAPQVEGQPSPFELTVLPPEAVKPADFKGLDVAFFTNVDTIGAPAVSALAVSALKEFVNGGGGVGFVAGAKIRPDEFNKTFAGIAPCKLWKTLREPKDEPVVMSWINLKHEIFRPFDAPHMGDFAGALCVQFFGVTDSQTASVLARFNSKNSEPALLEKPVGKGKSILFTSAMDLEWNNLCLKSVFVPFVHQVTRRLCAAQSAEAHNVIVGNRLAVPVPADVGKAELVTPAGKKQTLDVHAIGEGDAAASVAAFTAEEPGIYTLNYGQDNKQTARYAASLDPREPDLTRLDTRELVTAAQPTPIVVDKTGSGAPSVVAKSTARERSEAQQKLWFWLICAVVVALGVEMVLAVREQTA